jgi:hypothetical protein
MNWSWLRDRCWPTVGHLDPETAKQEAETRKSVYDPDLFDQALRCSSEMIDDAVDQCKELLDLERQRGQSVQDRLNSIIGLSAIAVTVTFGTLLGLVYGKEEVTTAPWYAKAITLVFILYILAQLVCAIFAALAGLARRQYMEPIPTDLLPNVEDTVFSIQRRRARSYLICLLDHYNNNSEKVEQLAVVHEALTNFLAGVSLLAVILITITFIRSSSSQPDRAKTAPYEIPSEQRARPDSNKQGALISSKVTTQLPGQVSPASPSKSNIEPSPAPCVTRLEQQPLNRQH